MLIEGDVGMLHDRFNQSPFDFPSGRILGMEDAPEAVATFAGQVYCWFRYG
jgi:hypothetical protein